MIQIKLGTHYDSIYTHMYAQPLAHFAVVVLDLLVLIACLEIVLLGFSNLENFWA